MMLKRNKSALRFARVNGWTDGHCLVGKQAVSCWLCYPFNLVIKIRFFVSGCFTRRIFLPHLSISRVILACLIGLLGCQNAWSATDTEDTAATTEAQPTSVSVDLKRFELTGDVPYKRKNLVSHLNKFLGKNKSLDDIKNAQSALTKELNSKGYSFYRVQIPPQELVDGIVVFAIQAFKVEKIKINNANHHNQNNLISSFPTLTIGSSPNTKDVARNLKLVNSNSSKNVRIAMSHGDEERGIVAELLVDDSKTSETIVSLSNIGSDNTGNLRIGLNYLNHNLWNKDHGLGLSVTTSENGFDEVEQFSANYSLPLYGLFSRLSAFAVSSNIDSGVIADAFEVGASGDVYGLSYQYLLPGFNGLEHSLTVQLTDKLFDNNISFLNEPIGVDVRSRPLTLRYDIEKRATNGRWRIFSEVNQNLRSGSLNNDESYQLTRSGANADWQTINFGGEGYWNVKNWTLQVNSRLHTTSDRLITGEQIGFGGLNIGRGFEEREGIADKGLALSMTAWLPKFTNNLLLGGFIDFASLKNNDANEGEFSSETLASTGLSLAWQAQNRPFAFTASLGIVLDGFEDQQLERSDDGDSNIHFSASYRF